MEREGIVTRLWERQYAPVGLVVIAAVTGAFELSEIVQFFIFLLVFITYVVRDYDFRILLGIGLLLILLGGTQQVIHAENNAAKAGDVAFYFLATGTFGELIKFIKGRERMATFAEWVRDYQRILSGTK